MSLAFQLFSRSGEFERGEVGRIVYHRPNELHWIIAHQPISNSPAVRPNAGRKSLKLDGTLAKGVGQRRSYLKEK